MGESVTSSNNTEKKLGLLALAALVVGSMIGGGAFNLPKDMASSSGGLAIIIGWIITGIGMISLGLCFQYLTNARPNLDGGVFNYAREGFGHYFGFVSAWGYWFSAFLGNVAYATLVMSSIGYFFPTFEGGQNVASIIAASLLLWGVHFLILRGVSGAAIINTVVTFAKLIPIFAFILAIIVAFNFDIFMDGFYGMVDGVSNDFSWGSLTEQVRGTMLVTLWVFIGIEGAVVFSSRAKNRADVGKATVLGLLFVLFIYILITLLSLGVMNQTDVANLGQPAMADLMEHIVGKWGATFINIGLIISVLGAWLGWTLLAAEIPYLAAKDGVFPKFFAKENANKAPINSLIVTNVLVQLALFSFLITEQAYQFMFSLASSAILIPYAFSAFYALKLSIQEGRVGPGVKIAAVIASIYGIWLVYAAGVDFLLLTMILYLPGILVFWYTEKQNTSKIVTRDWVLIGLTALFAVIAIYRLASGAIEI